MSPLIQSQRSLLAPAWAGYPNELWRRAKAIPSLDLRFADNKSLVDASTGQNLVTFTRASSGTYVDSQGVIQRATTNLCLQSENFTATWTNFLSTDAANAAVAPNGTLTADTIIPDSGATAGLIRQDFSGSAFTDNASLSFSVYVKAAGLTSFNIQFFNKANTFYGTQTINASTGGLSGSGTLTSTSVTNVGDGWYRVGVTGISAGSGATAPNVRIVITSTGNGTDGIYLWGAQLEQSSTVGEYIPTTSTINSAPRFDHNPTTGESLGLLVEEQRTNLLLRSEEFEDTYWSKSNAFGTVTANQATSPDGASAADLYQESTANSSRYLTKSISFTSGTSYTISIWAKQAPGETRYLGLILPAGAFGVNVGCAYTLSDSGTATITVSGTNTTASIQAFPGGWYRCVLSSQATITTPVGVQIRLSNSPAAAATTYTGDGFSGLYIWGAQLEAGSFPTSYIPTTTATATRSADVASITGSDFSSWYRQDEGTVFASARTNATHGGTNSFPRIHTISDGTNDNAIGNYFRVLSTYTDAGYGVTTLTVAQATFDTNNERNGQSVSTVYANNDFAFAVSGSVVSTDNTGTVPAVSQLRLGARGTGLGPLNGTIRRLTYWPQRLPNSTLQQITQ